VPLTERVSFKTRLQKGNRFQVSKYVRWRYKLESDQTLQVTVSIIEIWSASQVFFCKNEQGWTNRDSQSEYGSDSR